MVATATPGSTTHVSGSLQSTLNTSFSLDFYASANVDPSGYGQGRRYLGSTTVVTGNTGLASFSNVILDAATSPGESITATATDSAGNTSEFSADVLAQSQPPKVTAANATANTTYGQTASNTGTWYDPSQETVTLTASAGSITENTNGTWSWSFAAGHGSGGSQTVMITATSADGLQSSTSFQLTVAAAPLTITANSISKTYSQTVTFAGTEFTTSGLVSGDAVTSVTLTSAGAAAPAPVSGSPYAIVPGAAAGTGLGNYVITYDNGQLAVGQATPTVAVSDAGGTYNGTAFAATATVTGISDVPGSNLEGGGLTLTYYSGTYTNVSQLTGLTGSTAAPSTPGSYTVLASFAGSDDYAAATALTNFTIIGVGVSINGDVDVLNQTASGALTISGNAMLNVAGTLQVDSSSASAVILSGNADVNAGQTLIVGGDQVSGNAHFTYTPTTHAADLANPLAALAAPTGGTSYSAVNLSGNDTLTINPGIYPSITVSGFAHLILNPGIYIIGSGGITISGNATVTGGTAAGGQGVLIYNNGALTVSGNASVNVTAFSTGMYAGLAIFQAQNNANAVTVSGNANVNLNGSVLYDANVQSVVTISGNAQLEASLVVNELKLSGNSDDSAQ